MSQKLGGSGGVVVAPVSSARALKPIGSFPSPDFVLVSAAVADKQRASCCLAAMVFSDSGNPRW